MKVSGRSFRRAILWICLALIGLPGCGNDKAGSGKSAFANSSPRDAGGTDYLVVNSFLDLENPPAGVITLRSAMALLDPGGTIAFDASLDNATIDLSVVGEPHSILKGEVFTMAPGVGWIFEGFQERDYGASALYAAKDLTIDASALPSGITLRWTGGEARPARVLGVYGNLTLRNVTLLGGFSSAASIAPIPATDNHANQPWTLARGGGVACWGAATFVNCTFGENRVLGDSNAGRDRGAFGGAIYGDAIEMDNCIVSGNRAEGYGAAGGGIYSVSGRQSEGSSNLRNSAITGNRATGEHAYGGGVYTDGGSIYADDSIWSMTTMTLSNCTLARNLVEDNPAIPEITRNQYYCRGGGVYMSNGYLEIGNCTVAENEVRGVPAIFSGKPNNGGGGVAATVGNAHDVESMTVWGSALVGNKVNGVAEDLFTGSLLHFYSYGYNRIGRLDFSQMLVPIPIWQCLSRKHWPKAGDADGIAVTDALDVSGASRHKNIRSAGTDNGELALLWYPPTDALVDQVPPYDYTVDYVVAGYTISGDWVAEDNAAPLLEALMGKLRGQFGAGFGASLGDYSTLQFNPIASGWPSDNSDQLWIGFWRALDNEIGNRMGTEKLGDDFWGGIPAGPLGDGLYEKYVGQATVTAVQMDQRGAARPAGMKSDIGAIERPARPAGGDQPPVAPVAPAVAAGSGGCAAQPGETDGSGGAAGLVPLLALALWHGLIRRRRPAV